MACTDGKYWEWSAIPRGSEYRLSVVGPAGTFSAYAKFDHAGNTVIDTWPSSDIAPGPHREVLNAAGEHVVYVFVEVFTSGVTVQVKGEVRTPAGTVHPTNYCRTIGGPGVAEIVTHYLDVL